MLEHLILHIIGVVLKLRSLEKDGYNALVIGFEKKPSSKLKNPEKKFFSKLKTEPVKKIKETVKERPVLPRRPADNFRSVVSKVFLENREGISAERVPSTS